MRRKEKKKLAKNCTVTTKEKACMMGQVINAQMEQDRQVYENMGTVRRRNLLHLCIRNKRITGTHGFRRMATKSLDTIQMEYLSQ
jgi:hypothetical protein